MEEINGDPGSGINSNKRKIHDEILEVPMPKHVCLDKKNKINIPPQVSGKDSNSLSQEDVDSVMSLSDYASANWSGATSFDHKLDTDSIYNLYPCPSFEQQLQLDCPEYYETKQSQNDGDLFCSSGGGGVTSSNYVLSSGRWNIVNQDTEQITKKLTIDKEFEQYFSMLML